MRIRKFLFSILFLFSSNSINASEIGGIKIFQSAEGFLKIDNIEWRKEEFNNDIRSYFNNAFNLSFYSDYRANEFEIPNPDYFFEIYWIWEKEKKVIGIIVNRILESKILQQNFKIGECEQLRNQLVLEKEVKFNSEIKKTKTQSYHRSTEKSTDYDRSTEENIIYFEDRLSFNYIINDINVTHNFSCYYDVHFEKDADLGKKHLVTAYINEEILETNVLNQYEIFHKVEEIEEFNSNYIKNFKIWGNINEINYDEEEIFSLENYRLKSFQKHNEIKKQNEIKSKKKIDEEKKKYLEQEKLKAQKKPVAIWTEEKKKRLEQEKLEAQNKAEEEKNLSLFKTVSLRAQLMRCWNIPIGLRMAPEDMVVRVKLHLLPDGSIEEIEMLDLKKMNTPGKEKFRTLAESVERALQRCRILNVPPSGYEKWKKIIFKFDASEMLYADWK